MIIKLTMGIEVWQYELSWDEIEVWVRVIVDDFGIVYRHRSQG